MGSALKPDSPDQRERTSEPGGDSPGYRSRIYERYTTITIAGSGPRGGSSRSQEAYFAAKLGKWLPPDREAAILDAGCGSGVWLEFLRGRGYRRLAGVDLSAEQLAAARARSPGVELHPGDLLEFLAGKENEYDLVTALDVIEHLDKAGALRFLDLAWRSLRPGGGLILQTPNAASPWGMSVRYGDFTHECCFTPGSLGQLLAAAGFTGIEVQAAGPSPAGVKSAARWMLWGVISCYYRGLNLIETGAVGDGIYTRVFQGRAVKPGPAGGGH
jgi:SAM-dependent methyltransferase